MIENENADNLLLDEESTNTQAQSDDNLLESENKEENAFQVMQQKIKSYKEQVSKLEKEIANFKVTNNTEPSSNKDNDSKDVSNINSVLNNFKEELEGKLDNITKSFQQIEEEKEIKELDNIFQNFKQTYGLTGNELKNFVNAVDVSQSGYDNTFDNKIKFLLNYVKTPKIIEMELVKSSPNSIQAALDRKSKQYAKIINKQQSATVRAGKYSTNQNTETTDADKIVQKLLGNEKSKVELKYNGKAY